MSRRFAYILDFDGTIANTSLPWYEAVRNIYRTLLGVDLTPYHWRRVGKQESKDVYADVIRIDPSIDQKALSDAIEDATLVAEHHIRKNPWMPGAEHFIDSLVDAGIVRAVNTSGSLRWIEMWRLHTFGNRIETITTRSDVGDHRMKPHPYSYQETCKNLGIRPENVISIEDTPEGAEAALAAGTYVVVVKDPLVPDEEFPEVDLVLPSLVGVTPRYIESQLGRQPIAVSSPSFSRHQTSDVLTFSREL